MCLLCMISDAAVLGNVHPAVGFRFGVIGDCPDGHILSPDGAQFVGVAQVDRPVATVLIEVTEGGRLDSEGVSGHWLVAYELIIEGQRHRCCWCSATPATAPCRM